MSRLLETAILHAAIALTGVFGCGPGAIPRAPRTPAAGGATATPVASSAAAQAPTEAPVVGAEASRANEAPVAEAPSAGEQLRLRRMSNLDSRLHPLISALIHDVHAEETWARDGLLSLPASRCAAAIGTSEVTTNSCSLIGVGDGRAALLVLGAPLGCQGLEDPCIERSWVFLSRHPVPLALPTRRLSDFYGLRSAMTRHQASALWVAGFRSLGDDGSAFAAAPSSDGANEAPTDREVAYASCAVADDERELFCRSRAGDLLALDPEHGAMRLVARLGLPAQDVDLTHEPAAGQAPFWTADGRVAMRVHARRHPLCEGGAACELVALVNDVSTTDDAPAAVEFVRRAP